MRDITELKNTLENKRGNTVLLVGNGNNLHLTPPEDFKNYVTIGMNTIHLYDGWTPDYYLTVDRRVFREFGDAINKKMKGVTKVLPYPRLRQWHTDHILWYRPKPGLIWQPGRYALWQDDIGQGNVTYSNAMHIAIKLAYYMGAKTILIIGMEHEPKKANRHFWGNDHGMSHAQNTKNWFAGYKILADELEKRDVELLNISPETFVSEDIIKQNDFKKYLK